METIHIQSDIDYIVKNIQLFFQKEGYSKALIGLSGGIDSATSCALTASALGKDNVYPVLLPYGSLNTKGVRDAGVVLDWLGIPKTNVREIHIQSMTDTSVRTIESSMDEGRKGNIMARMRMIVLFDLAKAMHALVVGTENKTEHILGYYTRFGDEASDIEPLRRFYKTQVYVLARQLEVPKQILKTAPTAGLWEGQTDEEEFGFTYNEVDEVLSLHVDKHLSKKSILAKGYDAQKIERIWWWIKKGNFKDRMPYVLKSLRLR